MTQQIDPKQLQQSIRATIVELQGLGDLEDVRKELAGIKAQLDVSKRDLAGINTEFAETKRANDKLVKDCWDKQQELERKEAELKAKSAELANVTGQMNKIRQQLGG
jgi:hypothetical protein